MAAAPLACSPGAFAEVTYSMERATFEAAMGDLEIIEEGFEGVPSGTSLASGAVRLLGGQVQLELINTTPWAAQTNRIVTLPNSFGSYGIDSPAIAGNYLLGGVRSPAGVGDRQVLFTLDLGGECRGIGFDYSGAAGATVDPAGTIMGVEVTTVLGEVSTLQMPGDDGFLGVQVEEGDAIVSLRFADLNPSTTGNTEVFAVDNLMFAVPDASVVLKPVLPYATFRIESADGTTNLGNTVEAVGDVDRDGVPDFAVSGLSAENRGFVRVISGATGQPLRTIESPALGPGFAANRNLVALGDLDGDGINELAVGAPYGTDQDPAGAFGIYRLSDQVFLRSHHGVGEETLGFEIAKLGDLDGDGVSDYAASSFDLGNEGGRVRVYSGAGGEELGSLMSEEPVRFYSIAGPGDLDGDGRGDLAMTLWSEFDPWKAGEVRVLSGALFGTPAEPAGEIDILLGKAERALLLILEGRSNGPDDFEGLGQGLNGLGDLNGDGIPEIGAGTGPTSDVVVFSGADGRRLHEWNYDSFDLFQVVVGSEKIGDLDRDGFPDVAIGLMGLIRVVSGRDGTVLAERFVDDLGEEIAAIGDLDGDGVSEIAASAPGGGYSEVISFSLERMKHPETPSGFRMERQGEKTVAAWKSNLDGATLEQSTNLESWEPVPDVMFDSLYVVPPHLSGTRYYRLRFEP